MPRRSLPVASITRRGDRTHQCRAQRTDNIDVRKGDMLAAVAGEVFDLIAVHAAYVAVPDGVPAAFHMHGGPRGDEVVSRVVAGLPPYLAPGGHAVVHASGRCAKARRRRRACGTDRTRARSAGIAPRRDLATFWGQMQQHDATAVTYIRDHNGQLGLAGTEASSAVLRRGTLAPSWTAMLEVPAENISSVTAERIELLLRGCGLPHGSMRFCLPHGNAFRKAPRWPRSKAFPALLAQGPC
jgi:hypothetical protein